jgi:hypothetical protein
MVLLKFTEELDVFSVNLHVVTMVTMVITFKKKMVTMVIALGSK